MPAVTASSPCTVTLGTAGPAAPTSAASLARPQRQGPGPPVPAAWPGYFGPLCPRCPAGRCHCPRRRCPVTAGETRPAAPGRGGQPCPDCARIPGSLTPTRGTAALGVLQQLRGAAGPGSVPLLQPQPGRLILGEGAQILRVTPVHLGEKEQAAVSGRLAPQLSGETEAGEQRACQVRERAKQGKGAEVAAGAAGCPPGRGKEPGR